MNTSPAIDPDARLAALGLVLPAAPQPAAIYRYVSLVGPLAFVAGHGPQLPAGGMMLGQLGRDLATAEGAEAASLTALAMLATLRAEFGTLRRVRRLVKTLGLVNSAPGFTEHPLVINGFSRVMADVFGPEAGIGTRTSFGVAALPGGIAVEIECQFEVHPAP